MSSRRFFDAHLDLAYLALLGRDMTGRVEDQVGPHPPASITLGSLREGGVHRVLGTIFTEADGRQACGYLAHDPQAAHRAGLLQLEIYQRWQEDGLVRPLGRGADTPEALELGILMEGADPIRTPDELSFWKKNGVVAIGLSWWKSSRYAGGNGTTDGITPLGRDLLAAMHELGIVADVSHLSQRGTDELLEHFSGKVMASHSNCRSLLGGVDERHLSDESIRELGRRGAMIGLNLLSPFLMETRRPFPAPLPRAAILDCVNHLDHMRSLHGHTRCLGLGTDADGGLGADALPAGIDHPRDYGKIADALEAKGWSEDEVTGFCAGNWERFWGLG